MQRFRLATKLFYKNIIFIILFFLSFIFMNVNNIKELTYLNENILSNMEYLCGSLFSSAFYFIIFLFVSYEYFFKIKSNNLNECIDSINKGCKTIYFHQFIVMLCINGIFTLIMTAYNVGVYFYLNINKIEYLVHIISNIFVNFFMVSIIAILLGLCAALLFKRLKAYLILTCFAFLTSNMFESIAFTIFNTTGINIYPIYELFNLYSPALNWTPNNCFGFSLLPYRIELLLFWSFFILMLIFIKLSWNRKSFLRICAAFCAVLSAVMFFLYQQPSSKVIMSNNPSACLTNDLLYYLKINQKQETVDFEIIKYDLDINVTNLLKVKAKLLINKSDLTSYKFTLYHGYHVEKITDQNNSVLKFYQDSDYLEVFNNKKLNLSGLTITYSGYSPKFYSNSQGICLPGYFPYYPHSGYRQIFDKENQGFEKTLISKSVPFSINIKAKKHIYCNLEENQSGGFSGEANGITLMSGMLDKTTIQGIDIIYPYLNVSEFKYEQMEKYIDSFLSNKTDNQIVKKIFIMPNLNQPLYERAIIYSDYITARQLPTLSHDYAIQFIPKSKYPFYSLVNTYQGEKESFEKRVKLNQNTEFEDKMAVLFLEKIQSLGEDVVLAKADTYINEDNDKRLPMEFLEQLQ